MTQNSPQVQTLNIGSLNFHPSHPDTYTLFKLDASRLPPVVENPWEGEHLKIIGPKFLKKSLSSLNKTPGEHPVKHLECKRDLLKTSSGERMYYTISLYQERMDFKSSNLINYLHEYNSEADIDALNEFEKTGRNKFSNFACQASLVLFPSERNIKEAMAYGFGAWKMLVDHCCIVPKWGLTVLSSSTVFDHTSVKEVRSFNYRTSNPSTQTAKFEKPTNIETFVLEVGSQGLTFIRGNAEKAYNLTHLVKGDDYFQFSVKGNRSQNTGKHKTIESLEKIATHFEALTESQKFTIHEYMKMFIDQEVKDQQIIGELQGKIKEFINSKSTKSVLFMDQSLWAAVGGGKSCYFGPSKLNSPLEADYPPQNPLEQMKIQAFRKRDDINFTEIEILPFLSSNPLEFQSNFYRLERGRWYFVHASRFEPIKDVLRRIKISADFLGLPAYDPINDNDPQDKDYKELQYNKKVVRIIGENAIFLDRRNLSLDSKDHHKFEFCDVLLRKDGVLYIIHIKRATVKQLSHLREQVERTGDFLATELNKKSKKSGKAESNFLFDIIIEDFEKSNPLKARNTKYFQAPKFQRIQHEEIEGSDLFSKMQASGEIKDKTLKSFVEELKTVFPKKDYKFLSTHRDELMQFFDLLYYRYRDQKKKIKRKAKR